jgi:hypothetical protein
MGDRAERTFQVDEADALIPRLEFLIGRLQESARQLRERVCTLAEERQIPLAELAMPEVLRLQPGLHRLVEDINGCVHEIEELGGVFKDLELGLVDFPATIAGKRVYLCWQYGEKVVGFWHGLEDGFTSRRPLRRKLRPQGAYLQ